MTPGDGARRHRIATLLRRMGRALAQAPRRAFGRFPATILAVAGLSLVANAEVADADWLAGGELGRLVAALVLAAGASLVAVLFAESTQAGPASRAGLGFATAVGAGVLVWFGSPSILFVPPLAAAVLLAVPLAPQMVGATDRDFWSFSLWTFIGGVLGFASVLLFVLGISAILEMIRFLFGLGLGTRSYQFIYTTALTFVGPLFALSRIPLDLRDDTPIDRRDRVVGGIALLLEWVALPLWLATAAILHLYAGKIVMTGALPTNQIGWIVGTYAGGTIALRIAADPFLTTGHAAMRLFRRLWAFGLVVPLALLAQAIWLRVGAEGFTRERYYLVLLALAAGLVMLAQIPRRSRDAIRLMAAIPIVLLALSAIGPLGMASVVARSQTGLIVRDFTDAEGRLRRADRSPEAKTVLRQRIAALTEVDRLAALYPLLDEGDRRALTEQAEPGREDRLLAMLGLAYGMEEPSPRESFAARRDAPFDVAGYDRVYLRFALQPGAWSAPTGEDGARLSDDILELQLNGRNDRLSVRPVFAASPGPGEAPIRLEGVTEAGRHILLRVTAYSRDPRDPGDAELSFDLAVRRAEWSD